MCRHSPGAWKSGVVETRRTHRLATHAIPENARGYQRELHALPSQLGRIAQQADARMLILSHRMNRTRGRESQSRERIEEHYGGHILFANDGECWGL